MIWIAVALMALAAAISIAAVIYYSHKHPRHKHRGTEIGRRFVPGIIEAGGSVRGFADDKVIYGYTEITYKCSECGIYFNNRIVGRING